jgi:HD-GYP domain-containing protein (c-di-GMP phosphodiesterase class II)
MLKSTDKIRTKADSMSDYLPINSSSLRTDTTVGCDLYLQVEARANSRYILYCRGDAVFENDKREMLLEKNISRLFIKKNDQQAYYEYLETNFRDIKSDSRISSDEKTRIVQNVATYLVKDMFEDPKTGIVSRTKEFAYNMVDYILQDCHAAHSLLKIAVHEHYTYTHSVNVAAVGTLFGKNIGLADGELKDLCSGILMHDIGKTRISTAILNKNGKLTKEEFEQIKKHPELGVEVLKEAGCTREHEYTITLQHHENYDGTGYPYGLKKYEIHLCGKIARIIDVYDALTSKRPYSDAIRPFKALVEMKEKMLNCFDKQLFIDFVHFLGPYDPRNEERKFDKLKN